MGHKKLNSILKIKILLCTLFGGDLLNNDSGTIKARIDANLYEVLKLLLNKLNMTQQDLIESKVKEFVIENIQLVVGAKSDKK